MKKAVFLDRDGTLIVDKHYLKDPEQIELLFGVEDFIRALKRNDYLLFLFTNQSGISRGYYTIEDTCNCNERMFELLNVTSDYFTEICIAPEGPTDPQVYRKPSPRFILEMIEKYDLDPQQSWMIGDHLTDLQAGIGAGIKCAWVSTGKPLSEEIKLLIKNHKIPMLASLSFDDFFRVCNNCFCAPFVSSESKEEAKSI